MAANETNVLALIKLRLGIAGTGLDALVYSYVQEIGRRILDYCNIPEIPLELEYTWASMTIDALRAELPHVSEIAQTAGAGEITVGDTTSKPALGPELSKSVLDTLVLNYRADLNRYRRMRW